MSRRTAQLVTAVVALAVLSWWLLTGSPRPPVASPGDTPTRNAAQDATAAAAPAPNLLATQLTLASSPQSIAPPSGATQGAAAPAAGGVPTAGQITVPAGTPAVPQAPPGQTGAASNAPAASVGPATVAAAGDTAASEAQPQVPFSTTFAIVGGNVVVDGAPAPNGAEVRALCQQDSTCGLARIADGLNLGPGQFRMTVFGSDGQAATATYARDGDEIRFTVDGRPARVEPAFRWRPLAGEVIRLTVPA